MNWEMFDKAEARSALRNSFAPSARINRVGRIKLNRAATEMYLANVSHVTLLKGQDGSIGLMPSESGANVKLLKRDACISAMTLARHMGILGQLVGYTVEQDGDVIALMPKAVK